MEDPHPKPSETYVMRDLVLPNDTNQYQTLFGGTMLGYMDKAAFIAAGKFCGHPVVTASVDTVHFQRPVYLGEIFRVEAKVVDAGRTSLSVRVRVYREVVKDGADYFCCSGLFNMVAVDENMRPVKVPPIEFRNEEEVKESKGAKEIRESLRTHRNSQKHL